MLNLLVGQTAIVPGGGSSVKSSFQPCGLISATPLLTPSLSPFEVDYIEVTILFFTCKEGLLNAREGVERGSPPILLVGM